MTSTDSLFPVPSFDDVFDAVTSLAFANPNKVTPTLYVLDGEAHCLIAHVYKALGGNLDVILDHMSRNHLHLRAIWDALFKVQVYALPQTREQAEEYLVYALLTHIQEAQDTHLPWLDALVKGLITFRRFLMSPTSGFLVQTKGQFQDLRDHVHERVSNALVIATAPKG